MEFHHIAKSLNLYVHCGQSKATGNTYVLAALFTPRKFAVHGGQRLSPVMSNTVFRDRVKKLHDPLAADIKARCTEAFGIEDPVDVKIQNGLKDDLACIVWTELEGIEAPVAVEKGEYLK